MPMDNLVRWWNRSSAMDRDYGMSAYWTYHCDIAAGGANILITAAVFALLSPNSDYDGNLRSMRIVLNGFARRPYRTPVDQLQGLGTYRHCAERAYQVLLGKHPDQVFGPNAHKTYNFYRNILDPNDPQYVTIDGHMYNLWRGERTTLSEAKLKPGTYDKIAGEFKEVAQAVGVLPNVLQATLWQCWKRTHRIRFDPQIDLPLMPLMPLMPLESELEEL